MTAMQVGSAANNAAITDPAGQEQLSAEVRNGLRGSPKTLPSKLLYDSRGACLFDQITMLDEYYLTRAEVETLTDRAAEIAALAGPRCAVIEFGSGSGTKTRGLLDGLRDPVAYVPIDVSPRQLTRVASETGTRYPDMVVRPLCADYSAPFALPMLPAHARRLAFFPGSTIGNLHPAPAAALLRRIRCMVGSTGALLLGVDRMKDPATLNAAYNDRSGVTAAFNLNLLVRLNRELAADFDIARFCHRAWVNTAESRVEMHLESLDAQTVRVDRETFAFDPGETIWTESSYKYNWRQLESVVRAGGFSIDHLWTDTRSQFWVAFSPAAY